MTQKGDLKATRTDQYRVVKACKRCADRKVKCDGEVPRCGPCVRIHHEGCDILQHVLYTHDLVEGLRERISWLEGLVSKTYEDGGLVGGVPTGSTMLPRAGVTIEHDEPLVEEVGLLSLKGYGSYVGSMSGVTLTRLVSSAIKLYGEDNHPIALDDTQQVSSSFVHASYPSKKLAASYVKSYISRVHRWCPYLDLSALTSDLLSIYPHQNTPRQPVRTPFFIMMVFALGHNSPSDPHTPEDYFVAACGSLSSALAHETLDSVRALLLLCSYGLRAWQSPGKYSVNVWLVIGHALRLSIGLGISRNMYSFGELENESRRKIWWSVYAVERYVATGLSRVLGIRNTAIDAHYPRSTGEVLPNELSTFLGVRDLVVNLQPAKTLYRQRSLLGDIQETIYVALPRDGPPTFTIDEVQPRIRSIQHRLVELANEVQHMGQYDEVEKNVLHLAFHQATLLLHRPSPMIPIPSAEALDLCMGAARGIIQIAASAKERTVMDEVIPGWNGFLDIFLSGLTLLYCTINAPNVTHAVRDPVADSDILTSLDVLEYLAREHPSAVRYYQLYRSVATRLSQLLSATYHQPLGPQAAQAMVMDSGLASFEGLDLDQQVVEWINSMFAQSPLPQHDLEL